jgi:hypothetical protein
MANLKSLVDPKFNEDDVTILLVKRNCRFRFQRRVCVGIIRLSGETARVTLQIPQKRSDLIFLVVQARRIHCVPVHSQLSLSFPKRL